MADNQQNNNIKNQQNDEVKNNDELNQQNIQQNLEDDKPKDKPEGDKFVSPADVRMGDFINVETKDKDSKKEEDKKENKDKSIPQGGGQSSSINASNPNVAKPPASSDTPSDSKNPDDSLITNEEPSPEDIKGFIKALKEDVPKAWRTYHKKLDLPAFELVQQVLRGTEFDEDSIKQRIKIYQKELSKNIEKEFNLDPGTFRYDADEAIDPDTPSGVFLARLRQYEDELRNDVRNKIELAKQQQEKYKQLQEEDKQWFRETFFKDKPERVDEILDELSKIPQKIMAGELPAHKHPFSLRTMLLGVFFDELVEKIKEETEQNIRSAYESQGMFLTKQAPDDLKKISKGIPDEGKNSSKKKMISPLDTLIVDFLNK